MNAEWIDLLATLCIIGLAGWWLVRSLRAPAGCQACPPAASDSKASGPGVVVSTDALKIGQRR